jgi:hypothetical protein
VFANHVLRQTKSATELPLAQDKSAVGVVMDLGTLVGWVNPAKKPPPTTTPNPNMRIAWIDALLKDRIGISNPKSVTIAKLS